VAGVTSGVEYAGATDFTLVSAAGTTTSVGIELLANVASATALAWIVGGRYRRVHGAIVFDRGNSASAPGVVEGRFN